MAATFKKGQEVTYVGSWDNKGTVYYQQAVVYSCGKKRMVLTDATSGEEMGRNFSPELGDIANVTGFNWAATFPRMTDAEAEAFCLRVGARVVEVNRDEFVRLAAQENVDEAYRALQREHNRKLHEPRAIRRSGRTYQAKEPGQPGSMTLQAISDRIQEKGAALARSQDQELRFTLCGTRCRIWYGTDTGLHFGYKRPLMQGYEPVGADALAAYVHLFQF